PGMIRWPGVIKPGTEINEIVSHEDWVATFVAAAGEPAIVEKLLTGYDAGGKTFKVHLDGYDQRDLLSGKGPSKRKEYFYWTDDGNLAALRYDRWKLLFMEQRAEGLDVCRIRWSHCDCRRSSICGPTPSRRPSSMPATTTSGGSNARSCS